MKKIKISITRVIAGGSQQRHENNQEVPSNSNLSIYVAREEMESTMVEMQGRLVAQQEKTNDFFRMMKRQRTVEVVGNQN